MSKIIQKYINWSKRKSSLELFYISIVFLFFIFFYSSDSFNSYFWLPPSNAVEVKQVGRFDVKLSSVNGDNMPTIKFINEAGETTILNCEPSPYLNDCLNPSKYNNFFEINNNTKYNVSYWEYRLYGPVLYERIIASISKNGETLVNSSERIKEIRSLEVGNSGSKRFPRGVRLKKYPILRALNFGVPIVFFLIIIFYCFVPVIIKVLHKKTK